jgi:transcriptional regulator with XRE-family HTH domain
MGRPPADNPLQTTLQQRAAMAGLAQGLSDAEVAARAGYETEQGARLERFQAKLALLADKVGLTEEYILRELLKNTRADKTELAQCNGHFTDIAEVPDNPTRMKALDSAAKMRGMFAVDEGDRRATVQVQIITNVQLDNP